MRPARGDAPPCTSSDCDGTMHFVRARPTTKRAPAQSTGNGGHARLGDRMGWMCSLEPGHFSYSTCIGPR